MTGRDRRITQPGPLKWPARPGPSSTRSSAHYIYVLDADPGLAQELDLRGRIAARPLATAKLVQLAVGECELSRWFDLARRGPGLLVLDGLVVFETCTGDRIAAELVGAGDLLQASHLITDDLLERTCHWRVLWPARIAVLDGDFAERVRPFPQLSRALLRRACNRAAELDVLRAISSQPRLEIRLVLLLWHLSARWGRVEPEGVRLCLPLTHRLLGQLVAAERPSISHALKRLAQAGLITGHADDLRLHGTLGDQLESLVGSPVALVERPVTRGAVDRSHRVRVPGGMSVSRLDG
ncbi:MAG TPA: Crp/Fnr family transcriptional regulator [Solirubrobacteraceae bacterium]|nr:Crp/Fnr family transcriptional regulator [Solirubrobacteraceae bacterium]